MLPSRHVQLNGRLVLLQLRMARPRLFDALMPGRVLESWLLPRQALCVRARLARALLRAAPQSNQQQSRCRQRRREQHSQTCSNVQPRHLHL